MQEFLKKGGKIEKIPYGVTSQDLGVGNRNAFWDPPKTSTPKAWRRRETMKKKKKFVLQSTVLYPRILPEN